ncbi:uracil permease [Paenibacillus radicis (ex Gao et al. 2016)]|uniref:Uracil/xanthine transporter n=2 Tax=Bacillota TaxID=1239 RepID=A0A917MBV1_9BACL|nr:uracil permease [Paenibacillus radicis (ex Gao et al. 2016)]GGG91024.1 uracil/xanthine transporter [Paenibacillus radicis (ex Gao et al. 2016)]
MKREIGVLERPAFGPSLMLSLQHLFAMFGSTVLVPNLLGVDPAICLLMNGIGTLLYIFICKGKIPAYLGSSFAFIAPVGAVIGKFANPEEGYAAALGGFIITGLVFIIVALIIQAAGTGWIDVVFPPAAMGAIVAVIGLELIPVAAGMAGWIKPPSSPPDAAWALDRGTVIISTATLLITIIGSVLFRGFMRIIPILFGIVAGYLIAYWMGYAEFDKVAASSWVASPTFTMPSFKLGAILTIVPASLVVIAEHIGHLIVTSNIVKKDLSKDPGLHRSMLGNGISTMLSGFVGSTPNTTYGENIGVLAITRVYSTYVIGGAAVIAIVLSFFGKFSALIAEIPVAVMGGISLLLFGVIAASGLRMLVESKIDYSKPTNLYLTTIVLVVGLSGVEIVIGDFSLKGMGLATVVAIIMSLLFKLFDMLKLSNDHEASGH